MLNAEIYKYHHGNHSLALHNHRPVRSALFLEVRPKRPVGIGIQNALGHPPAGPPGVCHSPRRADRIGQPSVQPEDASLIRSHLHHKLLTISIRALEGESVQQGSLGAVVFVSACGPSDSSHLKPRRAWRRAPEQKSVRMDPAILKRTRIITELHRQGRSGSQHRSATGTPGQLTALWHPGVSSLLHTQG